MYCLTTQISFSQKQVIEFGRITGDNGPVHSQDLVVQGGLIVSCLPKILNDIMTRDDLHEGYTHSVSAVLEAKFRNKLPADKIVTVSFEYANPSAKISKLNWRLYDDNLEYCSGFWVIYKSRI
jgi:hypothetical protein